MNSFLQGLHITDPCLLRENGRGILLRDAAAFAFVRRKFL